MGSSTISGRACTPARASRAARNAAGGSSALLGPRRRADWWAPRAQGRPRGSTRRPTRRINPGRVSPDGGAAAPVASGGEWPVVTAAPRPWARRSRSGPPATCRCGGPSLAHAPTGWTEASACACTRDRRGCSATGARPGRRPRPCARGGLREGERAPVAEPGVPAGAAGRGGPRNESGEGGAQDRRCSRPARPRRTAPARARRRPPGGGQPGLMAA